MKNAKKFASLLLALIMVFALAAPTFADDPAPATYKITLTGAKDGHKYTAYQVFDGDLSGTTLSNIVWGSGVDSNAILNDADFTKVFPTLGSTSSANAVALALVSGGESKAAEFAKLVAKHVKTGTGKDSGAYNATNSTYEITGLDAGYYIVMEDVTKRIGQTEADAYSDFILRVVGDATAAVKTGVPTVEKKVKDVNDSVSGTETGWVDSADYDIGDNVPFKLTATLGDVSAYKTYKIVFHDTMSKGLTLNANSIKVTVAGTTLNNTETDQQYTVASSTDQATGVTTFSVTINDVLKYNNVGKDSKITVDYTARLNENAVIGAAGNPNTVKLEFSNNPNSDTTGETPEDKVTVFTFNVIVNKVDSESRPLAGAEFKLVKILADNTEQEVSRLTKNTEGTTFTWKGLDAGNYKIIETKAPAGYNKVQDITFSITADHQLDAVDPQLTRLAGADSFAVDLNAGTLTTAVVNQQGSVLPGTGGIGTTIFYIVGSVLLVGAAVLLITKKRVSAEEK